MAQEQLVELRGRAVESYRAWGGEHCELEKTEREREGRIELVGSAVLAVLTGFVVQLTTVPNFDSENYFEFARTILRQA